MNGNISEYGKKRHFPRTPEPEGTIRKSSTGRLYVIHKHAATRLHYDLRLELEGVLKSWAVPKGPSVDPGEKRLAVHVEDHPIDYSSFEGKIPEGEYGAGTVMLWDSGEWESLGDPVHGYEKGHLSFRLHGKKLSGVWTLARMSGEAGGEGKNWLLIKKKDDASRTLSEFDVLKAMPLSVLSGRSMEEIASAEDDVWHEGGNGRQMVSRDPASLSNARKSAMPKKFHPQNAVLAADVPRGDNWLHEIKYDGYRMLCFFEKGSVRLISRNDLDWTARFKGVAKAASALSLESGILDGEIVVLKSDGRTDFQALQNVLKGVEKGSLIYYLFDIPFCNGYDLTQTPLIERKNFLKNILPGKIEEGSILRYSDHIQGKGSLVYRQACGYELEGVISKAADSTYEQKRSPIWRKIKCLQRQEFVIGGYTDRSGGQPGFGALVLGYYEQDRLIYAGRAGTGFNERTLRDIYNMLSRLETKTTPFDKPPVGPEAKGVHWVKPEKVAEVEFSDWTSDERLRRPSFKGIREDKSPREIRRERPVIAPEQSEGKAESITKNGKRFGKEIVTVAGVTLSNPERILYPEQDVTKQELALFYEAIADHILPHLIHRPLTTVRCPEGWDNQCFFQKHLNETMPKPVRGVIVNEDEEPYIVIDDLRGLITLVQHGVLEFHPMASREDSLETPDLITFDLDPDPVIQWEEVIRCALLLRNGLLEYGFDSFVKTTGGKGLHVVAPLTRRSGWDETKAFAGAIARMIVRQEPKKYIATMSKARRAGKIFIDYFRNSRGQTSVAPYSTRARKGAPVSTPLTWEELITTPGSDHYNIQNVRKRLSRLKKDPWEGYFKISQSITESVKKDLKLK